KRDAVATAVGDAADLPGVPGETGDAAGRIAHGLEVVIAAIEGEGGAVAARIGADALIAAVAKRHALVSREDDPLNPAAAVVGKGGPVTGGVLPLHQAVIGVVAHGRDGQIRGQHLAQVAAAVHGERGNAASGVLDTADEVPGIVGEVQEFGDRILYRGNLAV